MKISWVSEDQELCKSREFHDTASKFHKSVSFTLAQVDALLVRALGKCRDLAETSGFIC